MINRLTASLLFLTMVFAIAPPSLIAADWPSWAGPDGSRSNDSGQALVERFADAKVRWISEETFPNTYVDPGSLTGFPITHYCPPIVAEGRVYYVYPMPDTSSPLDPSSMLKLENSKQKIDLDKAERSMRQLGDDIIVCIDAATGKTVWQQRMVGKGASLIYNSNFYAAPIVADGRVYVLGSWLMAYCLDAKTGEILWETPVDPGRSAWKAHFDQWLAGESAALVADYESGKITRHKEHYTLAGLNITSPVLVDGVLVCNDSGGRHKKGRGIDNPTHLVGIDAETGTVLWQKRGVIGNGKSPMVWTKDGRSLLITPTGWTFSCLDPKTGNELWKHEAHSGAWGNNTLGGDYLIIPAVYKKEHGMACYKISKTGMTRLWVLGREYSRLFCSAAIYKGHVFGLSDKSRTERTIFCAELESGTVIKEQAIAKFPVCNSVVAADDRIWWNSAFYFHGDPKSPRLLELLGPNEEASPSSRNRLVRDRWTCFTVVEGQLYYRAGHKIICADFRK